MKKKFKILLILFISIIILTGCTTEKRNEIVCNDATAKVTFNVKGNYKITKNKSYFRTAREKAIIVDSNFKVGIEFNNDLADEGMTFDKFMDKYKKEEDFKKVKYSGMDGFLFYTKDYLRYEVYLKVNDKLILRLNLYSPNDNKKATTTALESEEVQDILNHITVRAN